MKQTVRILPRVYLVGSSDMTSSGDCMVYLVDCTSELALIDAGVNSNTDMIDSNIRSLGLEPKTISTPFITHCHIDHAGGAASFWTKYGCKTIAHKLDSNAIEQADSYLTGAFLYRRDLVPCEVDVKLSGSDGKIRAGDKTFRWIHTPGHTPGSIAILLNTSGGNILFAQDIHGPFMPEFNSKISDWVKSAKKLIKLDFDVLAEGHFGVFRPKDKAVEYIKSCLTRCGYR